MPVVPETILANPFNRKEMEIMKTNVRKPSAEYMKTITDRTIVSKPTTTSKPLGHLGKTLTNPLTTTLGIP